MTETIIAIAIVGALNVVCFFVGSSLGKLIAKGGNKQMPSANPIKAVKEHKSRKEAEARVKMSQDRMDTIMRNIDRYDGTPMGQEDVPRG